MYIAENSPTELWENKSFVYDMIEYANEYLSSEGEKIKEFLDLIPSKFCNDKDFVLVLLEYDSLIYEFELIQEYISEELSQDEEIMEKLEEYE